MAKKQSPRKPARKGKPDRIKSTDKSEPEKVKIGPLDPPPPESGGGTTGGDENQGT
jgi:hypothetical protein